MRKVNFTARGRKINKDLAMMASMVLVAAVFGEAGFLVVCAVAIVLVLRDLVQQWSVT